MENTLALKPVGEWPWAFFASQLSGIFNAASLLSPSDAEHLGVAVRRLVVSTVEAAAADGFSSAVLGKSAF